MDFRKPALIATWFKFWLVTLLLYFYNVEDLEWNAESDSTNKIYWAFWNILSLFGFVWDLVIFAFWFRLPTMGPCSMIYAVAIQACFVCYSTIFWITHLKIGIWLMIASNLIKCIPQFIFYHIQRPTHVHQLTSQPRPNLLANQPPTALTNFEDVEQPPPSYEECMDQRNDLPPK